MTNTKWMPGQKVYDRDLGLVYFHENLDNGEATVVTLAEVTWTVPTEDLSAKPRTRKQIEKQGLNLLTSIMTGQHICMN